MQSPAPPMRVGGVGLELLKATQPRVNTKGKEFNLIHLWSTSANTGRASLPLFLLSLASAAVALAFGHISMNLTPNLQTAYNLYRPFPNYYTSTFTSLFVANRITDMTLVSMCLFWGALINGIGLVILTYFLIAGAGRRSRAMLRTFAIGALGVCCGYLTMAIISLVLGSYLYGIRGNFTDACNRLSPTAAALCLSSFTTIFNQVQQYYLGGGVPMLFCGAAMLVCFGLQLHASMVITSTNPVIETLQSNYAPSVAEIFPVRANDRSPWIEVPGYSNVQPGVGAAAVLVQDSVPPPVNVAPALTALTGGGVDYERMAQQMDQLGETEYARQYRQAQQQVAQFP